jgi:hypothetical protein
MSALGRCLLVGDADSLLTFSGLPFFTEARIRTARCRRPFSDGLLASCDLSHFKIEHKRSNL